ncbi:MAG: oligosaccharide flippase family protein [Myxococcales bacterium]|nr:oligosaccharide flippase family protein [Myxococcales bacterium]
MSDAESASASRASLGQRAVEGVQWTVTAQVAVNVLRLIGNMVSAAFIDPAAFGLMAVVGTVIHGLTMISDVGIEQGVIYDERGDDPKFIRTAYTLQVLRGIILGVIALFLAYPLASLIDVQLISLIPVVCLHTVLGGATSMKVSWNKRNMTNMRGIAFVDIGAQVAAFVVTIALAWWLRSVWALALSAIAFAASRSALSFVILSGPLDGFSWDKDSVRRIVRYGRWIFVSTFVTFFSLRFDIFALGAIAGTSILGLYNMALMLTSTINIIGYQVTQSVLFPALAEASRTKNREILQATFTRSRQLVLPIGLWCITGLSYAGPLLFHFAYRDKFLDAGWMLQLQVTFVWFVFLTDAWTRALMAVGDNRGMAFANIVRLIGAVIFTPLGYYINGITGFILGLTAASIAAHGWVHFALWQHGLRALKLDIIYSAIAALLLGAGIIVPKLMETLTGIHHITWEMVMCLIVGIPFTIGLVIYIQRNINAAKNIIITPASSGISSLASNESPVQP